MSSLRSWFTRHTCIWRITKLTFGICPYLFLATIAMGFVLAAIPGLNLWVGKLLIDRVAIVLVDNKVPRGEAFWYVAIPICIQIGLSLATKGIGVLRQIWWTTIGDIVEKSMTITLLDYASRVEMKFYESPEFYNQLELARNGASSRPLQLIESVSNTAQSILTLGTMIALVQAVHWMAAPLITVCSLPGLLIQLKYGAQEYMLRIWQAPENRKRQYLSYIMTNPINIKELRVFGLDKHFQQIYGILFGQYQVENRRLVSKQSVVSLFASIVSSLCWFGLTLVVVGRIITRTATIGDFSLYSQAISQMQGLLDQIYFNVSSINRLELNINTYFKFIDNQRDNKEGLRWNDRIEEIKFCDVTFRYPGTTDDVLCGVNLSIRRGQTLALVGSNGSGKSTLVKLMVGLYSPTKGKILINGIDYAQYDSASIREMVAVLFQDYGVYPFSARENIWFGNMRDDMNSNDIESAATLSGIHDVIEGLPNGYQTELGRLFGEGINLSTGQSQRLALARSLFGNKDVIVLDEPTAAMDPLAEQVIIDNVLGCRKQQAIVLVSHRLSTVSRANQIIVLAHGGVAEKGTHDQLMEQNGIYAQMYNKQAEGYIVVDENRGQPSMLT